MYFVKTAVLATIVVLTIAVLGKLMKRRMELRQLEGLMLFGSQNDDMNKIVAEYKFDSRIQPLSTDGAIVAFVIKSAYDAANSGSYLNTDMITFLIKRGCRYLDFGVQEIADETTKTSNLYVSNDGRINNSILLSKALQVVLETPVNDPLFINLRIPTMPETKLLPPCISTLGTKVYKGVFSPNMMLSACSKKIVVFVSIGAHNYCWRNNKMEKIGNSGRDSYAEMLDMFMPDKYSYPSVLKTVVPNDTYSNMDIQQIVNHKYQISPFQFYSKDDHLDAYEDIFDHFHSAFVRLNNVAGYLRDK